MTVSDSWQLLPKPGWYPLPKLYPSYLVVDDATLTLGVWFPLPNRWTPPYFRSMVHRGDPSTVLTCQRRTEVDVFWIETADGRPLSLAMTQFRSTPLLADLNSRNWPVRRRPPIGIPGWTSTPEPDR
jgi:hypothetical protein